MMGRKGTYPAPPRAKRVNVAAVKRATRAFRSYLAATDAMKFVGDDADHVWAYYVHALAVSHVLI